MLPASRRPGFPIKEGGITAANAGSLQTVATWDKDEAQELAWAPDGASLVIAAYHLYRYTPEGAATDLLSDQQWSDALSVGSGSDGALRILISQGDGVGLLDGNGGQVALYPGLRSAGGTALSADGSLVAVGIGSVVKLLEAASGRELATLQGPPGGVRPVALSGDGKWLAAGATRIALWNLTEALAGKDQPLTTLDPGNGVYTLAFAPDGQTLASAGEAGVRVWRVPGGNLYRRLQETATHALGWSPDGRLIASSTQPALVKIWDVAGGQEVASLAGHATQPNSVAFSPDGTRLASCGSSSESSVRLWGLP